MSSIVAQIEKIGVVGSGTMGNGIAQVAATAGFQVLLFDISKEQLDRAIQTISKSLSKLSEKGKLKESPDSVLKRLSPSTQLSDLGSCQFVIEAATENREIKFKLFSDLDRILAPGVVIATNTSSILKSLKVLIAVYAAIPMTTKAAAAATMPIIICWEFI
ncbi:hypothetical protein EBT16_04385 [bacterium]|nr:hypothetical protein [bacterium]